MIRAGQRLQEARLQKKLTLEQVSKAIKIKEQFLSAIEQGKYEKLPSRTYAYGFVKNYADYLGLSKRETLALFRREFNEEQIFKVLPDGLAKQSDFPVSQYRWHRSAFIIGSLVLSLAMYILFQYRFAFINPPLEVATPKEKQLVTSDFVEVKGKTDPNATVSIGSIPVTLDGNGNFAKKIDVLSGEATIEIKAVNRFGKETVVKRNIEVKSVSSP